MARPKPTIRTKICKACSVTYEKARYVSVSRWEKQSFCSKRCVLLGTKRALGYKHSEESRLRKSKIAKEAGCGLHLRTNPRLGEKHPLYKKDRTQLSDQSGRKSRRYREWKELVRIRDGGCRMANDGCSNVLETHHILSWSDYPELRYEVNNGIILCGSHHPRGKRKEREMSPYFQRIVSINICQ